MSKRWKYNHHYKMVMITNETDQFHDAVGFAVGGSRDDNDFDPYAPTTLGEVNRCVKNIVNVSKDARYAPFPPTCQALSYLDHEGYDNDNDYDDSNNLARSDDLYI
eukprot:12521298-Ditylum_brightwellii.AAC.1